MSFAKSRVQGPDPVSWSAHRAAAPRLIRSASEPLVLIVDDDGALRRYLATVLRDEGFRVSRARDGIEALEKAVHLGPSVIIIDLYLPRLDGVSVIRWLKTHPQTHQIPIVAVTGYGADEDASCRAREAGCDALFAKPLPLNAFIGCLRQLAGPALKTDAECL